MTKMYTNINKIQLDDLNDAVKFHSEKLNNESHSDKVLEKYLKIIDTNFLKKRISLMIDKNYTHITLICDVITDADRSIDREQLITIPLHNLKCDLYENQSILSILLQKIPDDYRLYYHYNKLESSSYNINYEITIYRGNMFMNDPWCWVICCWETHFKPCERNEDYFDKEVIQ